MRSGCCECVSLQPRDVHADISPGIVRRFLDALKGETFSKETFPAFMDAFSSLVRCSLSAEVLRSLALFVTYALHKSSHPPVKTLRPKHSTMQIRRRRTDDIGSDGIPNSSAEIGQKPVDEELSRPLVGVKVLDMFAELLCEERDSGIIRKFARTVTNKVGHNLGILKDSLTECSGYYTFSQRTSHPLWCLVQRSSRDCW